MPQIFRLHLSAVIEFEPNIKILCGKDRLEKVICSERTINKTQERLTTSLYRRNIGTVLINRSVDKKAWLSLSFRFLNKFHFSRCRCRSSISRRFHRLFPDRFSEHVVADSNVIAVVHRLEIDDCVVLVALVLGPNLEVADPFALHLCDQACFFIWT